MTSLKYSLQIIKSLFDKKKSNITFGPKEQDPYEKYQ